DVVAAAKDRAERVVAAGLDGGDLTPSTWKVDPDGCGRLTIGDTAVRLPLRGVHNLRNAMLAFAVAQELGVAPEAAAHGIERMAAPPMRVNIEQHGAATLINDAYNSNPGSARAALDLLRHAGVGRQRVAVLATMLELGPQTPRLHDEVARDAMLEGIDSID